MTVAGRELYEHGLAREQAGDGTGAFEAYRRSAKANPRVAAPYVGLARILSRNHQRADALDCLRRAVGCEPRNPTIQVLLGRLLSEDGRLIEARQAFERALSLGHHEAAIGLGGVWQDLGDRDAAARVYGEFLRLAPGDAAGLAGLLGVASGASLAAAVLTAEERLMTAADTDAAVIGYALGRALARCGRHDEAFAAWRGANAARRRMAGPFDRAAFDARIDLLIEIF